jgi:DNA-binding NarL/FixJ family response regulator
VIRTLVCAPSEFTRANLTDALRGDRRVEVVGNAAPDELARAVAALDPDVVVEERDHANGRTATPTVALVGDPRGTWTFEGAGERGAYAILALDATPGEIVAAVIAVAGGLIAVAPRTLAAAAPSDAPRRAHERLTAREIDVLRQLARGTANKTIAHELAISEHTVKFHIGSIFAKLGVTSRTEAVAQGLRLGLIML